jgi:DNA-binding NarL/FixJ family response regulator
MSEWRSLVERARRFNPTVADALLGAFLLVVALPQLFIDDPTYRHLGITFRAGSVIGVLLLAAETLPLTWRRRSPRAVLAVLTTSAVVLLLAALAPHRGDRRRAQRVRPRAGRPAAGSGRRMIRVLIVDDQPLMRTGFRMILDAEPDIEVVGQGSDGFEALELADHVRPDVVLMDIRMPRMDGIEATRHLAGPEARDPVRVLILTTFDLDELVLGALRAGASGFLLKDAPPEDMVEAIRVVARGDALIAPSVTRRLLDRFASKLPDPSRSRPDALDDLTARELEVLGLVARGMSNAEIAELLVVSETTVKTHVGRILSKLNLRDRVQAVVLAYETGIVQPGIG